MFPLFLFWKSTGEAGLFPPDRGVAMEPSLDDVVPVWCIKKINASSGSLTTVRTQNDVRLADFVFSAEYNKYAYISELQSTSQNMNS